MTHEAPLSPRPLSNLADAARCRVLSSRVLREHGVSAAVASERCRPGGPWQMLLPGIYLLHAGPPTSDERLHAALLYTGRLPIPSQPGPADAPDARSDRPLPPSVPRQASAAADRHAGADADPAEHEAGGRSGDTTAAQVPASREAMITGLAALALHRFSSVPPLRALDRIDVLVPRTRRLRSVGCARIVRGHDLPRPEEVTGLPVAPVPRALADAVGQLSDAVTVRRLLSESVRGGHCEAQAVVRELTQARLLGRPHVVDAVDGLLAEGRAVAEGRLYEVVFAQGLPDPCWNVGLCLPGGPRLGRVDAYWPVEAVALQLDTRATRRDEGAHWSECAREREAMERTGITVVHVTPKKLRDAPEQQAMIVRTALMTAAERAPAEYVVVKPS